MENIIKKSITTSLTYTEYSKLIQDCVSQQKTTGEEQSEERIEFTKLNASRMRRLDKMTKLSNETIEAFKNVPKQTWIVISESWCGDAAQTLPILNKIVKNSSSIQLKIVLRDSNLDFMNAFLTNGAQAVPKLIIVDENYDVIDTWGARSKAATQLVVDYKKEYGKIDAEFKKNLQVWYNKDKGQSIINDLIEITNLVQV
ncbi:MAG: thioredoxin family protein [Flavobacteriaceae bacterium]|nr:thioredoxin family protein [Flavobacteriaceae bacterium]